MEKHVIRKNHRLIDGQVSRREFIKLTGRAGLVSAAQGLIGGLIGCNSYISQAAAAETEVLPGRPYHHTADGFRNPPGSPAVHFSSRSLFDRNDTLWTGYSISDGYTRVYFSGDTGYHSFFEDLGRRYGPFDLGMVPIGAYYKRASNLKSTHTTPEEAVRLGKDLRVKTLVPMHWGALVLSYEPPFEPPVRFLKAGLAAGFSEDRLWKMAVGETRVLG